MLSSLTDFLVKTVVKANSVQFVTGGKTKIKHKTFSSSHYQGCRWRQRMLRNVWYHRVMFSVKVNVSAGLTWCAACLWCARRWDRLASWPPPVLSLTAETVAASPHLALVYAEGTESGSWFVEVCDREMERDGGWTGRARADRYSVMNINGLQVSLSSSGLPFWKQAVWERIGPASFALFSTWSHCIVQSTHGSSLFFLLSANHAEVFQVAF